MRISDWSSDVCSSDLIRRLTWHGNNKMERMNLPTAAQGGFNYADSAVMFRRLTNGSFELIVTPWESDLARSWRQASAQRQTLFCLGTVATNRVVGLLYSSDFNRLVRLPRLWRSVERRGGQECVSTGRYRLDA